MNTELIQCCLKLLMLVSVNINGPIGHRNLGGKVLLVNFRILDLSFFKFYFRVDCLSCSVFLIRERQNVFYEMELGENLFMYNIYTWLEYMWLEVYIHRHKYMNVMIVLSFY